MPLRPRGLPQTRTRACNSMAQARLAQSTELMQALRADGEDGGKAVRNGTGRAVLVNLGGVECAYAFFEKLKSAEIRRWLVKRCPNCSASARRPEM